MCDNFFSGTGVPPGFGLTRSSPPGKKSGRDARSTARGYVLLLTLFLLVIAAVAMVGVARASMNRALAAVDARRDLQQRWGTLSAARALLPRAATVIDAAEGRAGHPLPAVAATVELGGESFTLTFADEQAKANLNALYAAGKRPAAERAARDASSGLSVRLRPMPVPEAPAGKAKRASEVDQILARLDAEESRQKKSGKPAKEADLNLDPALLEGDEDAPPPPPPVFVGFGQIFDAPPPDALRRATASLTLWGDGRADPPPRAGRRAGTGLHADPDARPGRQTRRRPR